MIVRQVVLISLLLTMVANWIYARQYSPYSSGPNANRTIKVEELKKRFTSEKLRQELEAREQVVREISQDEEINVTSQHDAADSTSKKRPLWRKSKNSLGHVKSLEGVASDSLYRALKEQDGSRYGILAIYGDDTRKEPYNETDPNLGSDAEKVVSLLPKSDLRDNFDGTYTILVSKTLGQTRTFCSDEKFTDQPAVAYCTGFAVSESIIATAGHCLDTSNYRDFVFVYGYRMINVAQPNLTIDSQDVCEPEDIIGTRNDNDQLYDYALVKVKRKIPAGRIASIRTNGKIQDGQAVHVIGDPCGLPIKIAVGAHVRDNSPENYFTANLDTYGGNSGSPVFNSNTHVVEGILIRGERDFVLVDGCYKSLVCPTNGCSGEFVARTSQFLTLLLQLH